MIKQVEKKTKYTAFLKDVAICALGSYGGPEAHFGVFTEQMVIKKKYINEEEMAELIALTSILPGPSSTQTITAIGYKIGGPILGFLTLLIWALPPILIMTFLSFISILLTEMNLGQEGLRYIAPMAVGFILLAAYRLTKKIVTDNVTLFLLLLGAVSTYFVREAWIFPLVLLIGGMVSIFTSGETNLFNKVKLNPPWIYLVLFLALAAGSFLINLVFDNILLYLFETFYRFGYLVIGGGQVVIPLMYNELVEVGQHMSGQEFLTGYGLVQGLPGPMFSFSAYAGGIAASGDGNVMQALGALISGLAIFLPGTLLIYFILPIWNQLKEIKAIKVSLKGITAVAGGLIVTSALILMQKSGFSIDNILIMALTIILLFAKKIPAPIIVVIVLLLGFIF